MNCFGNWLVQMGNFELKALLAWPLFLKSGGIVLLYQFVPHSLYTSIGISLNNTQCSFLASLLNFKGRFEHQTQ